MTKTIIWAAVYEPSIDEEIGIPVRDAEPARQAMAKRQIRLITKEEAERMNARVSSHLESTKTWLEQRLAERWAFLKEQGYSE